MNESGFNKLYWGFLFIMLSFRIQGFDILPDIVGYLFFASGFSQLISNSKYFSIAAKYNMPMIILSILSIYQAPAQSGGINLGLLGIFSIPIAIASFVLNLLVVYNLFMGINDMAKKREQTDLVKESEEKWNQYKLLQIASVCSFILIFIPLLGVLYIIAILVISIVLTISILGFMKRCTESLGN
ncbi:hypothetical protein G9F72_014050 [Clostridium estertheticum]|uniref:hypothetical protein n=1 Tax=Clostridium estertheticum TaxID=238834 RepID=UPI0013E951FB|nr:hypothetical protein [Clostridium estertheticum]MBZ9687449.1 hypothetical protein [Clostridium estertheticum]